VSLPEARASVFPCRAGFALACAVLASCGGGQADLSPQQRNPASGIYSGADSFGNPATVVITPDGHISSVTVSKGMAPTVVSGSTGAGSLTPIVFSSAYLDTYDPPTGQSLAGLMTVVYRQSVSIDADFSYPFLRRTLSANILPESFSQASASSLPAASSASIYRPSGSTPPAQERATWALSADGNSFSLSTPACVLTGTLSPDPSINVHIATITGSPGCSVGDGTFTGFLWRDTPHGYAYAVMRPTGQQSLPPIIAAVKL
jgi:hypothetical protein